VFSGFVNVDSGTGTFAIRLGGTPDLPDGAILATLQTQQGAPGFEAKIVAAPSTFGPTGNVPTVVKLTGATDNPATTCRIQSARVVLVG
jgi:hypothetical protein